MDRILVSAVVDGYRRAGRPWSTTPEPVRRGDFTDAQWRQLEADPRITVFDASDGGVPDDAESLKAALADRDARIAELEAQLAEARPQDETPTSPAGPGGGEGVDGPDAGSGPTADSGSPGAGGDSPAGAYPTRDERIRGAVATALEADGPELRTRTGRPVLSRVRAISGVADVSARERDAAWAEARGDSPADG